MLCPTELGPYFPSSEDETRSSFRNVALSIYLEFRTMAKVHKPIDSESYTPQS
jgi:hypothetical protein